MIYLIITAAGISQRFNDIIPKQFHKINDKELLKHTIDIFDCIDEKQIYVGLNKNYVDKFQYKKCINYIGGENGQETIYNGLKQIIKDNNINKDDIVIIQDGNRPCTSDKIIYDLLNSIKDNPNDLFCPHIPIYGLSSADGSKQYNRNDFVYTQMPCVCNLIQLYSLYSKIEDLSVYSNPMEIWCNYKPIKFVNGDLLNIKVTYQEDMILFNKINKTII